MSYKNTKFYKGLKNYLFWEGETLDGRPVIILRISVRASAWGEPSLKDFPFIAVGKIYKDRDWGWDHEWTNKGLYWGRQSQPGCPLHLKDFPPDLCERATGRIPNKKVQKCKKTLIKHIAKAADSGQPLDKQTVALTMDVIEQLLK